MKQVHLKLVLMPTSFPPIASNIFSSCTRSCCVLFMRMQGCGEQKSDWRLPTTSWGSGSHYLLGIGKWRFPRG